MTVSVSTVLPTSATSSSQLPAFLVGQIFVRQNAMSCLSLRHEHSSADGVSMLQPQPSGTCFHHSSAHHPLVVDSLELGFENPSLHTELQTPLRTFVEERIILHYIYITLLISRSVVLVILLHLAFRCGHVGGVCIRVDAGRRARSVADECQVCSLPVHTSVTNDHSETFQVLGVSLFHVI